MEPWTGPIRLYLWTGVSIVQYMKLLQTPATNTGIGLIHDLLTGPYFSNTISNEQYVNLFPSGSISVDFAELLRLRPINVLKLYATASRTLREAPLLYTNWSYGSINLPVERYTSFYESTELFFNDSLTPETERKFEAGLKFRAGPFHGELSYFNNITDDFILPQNAPGGFELSNVASIKNVGGIISAGYLGYLRNGHWGIDTNMEYV